MLQTMIVTIVALPFALGIAAAVAGRIVPTRGILIALLVPLSAAVILVGLDGLPAFPPVRAAHKLPYVLALGGLALAAVAWRARPAAPAVVAAAGALSLALPVWWLGRNVLANNSQKAVIVAVLVALAVAGLFLAAARARQGKADGNVLLQAVFATSLAGALVAIFGGYMGMAMFNGALAAFAGGALLVTYLAWLHGNDAAFSLSGVPGYAFAWVALMGVIATALLAPQGSAGGLIATVLTLAAVPLSGLYARRLAGLPRALRPLVLGLVAAIPALVSILIAGLQYPG